METPLVPLHETWHNDVPCPCGRPTRNLQRVYTEPPPPRPVDSRRCIMERYHHNDGSICQVTSQRGVRKVERVSS